MPARKLPTPETIETPDPRDLAAQPNWGVPVNGTAHGAALDALPPEEDEAEETPADRVRAVLDMVRDSERAEVKLFRVTGPNQYGWCEDYSIEQFEAGGFGMIRDNWGPGEYEIRLYSVHPVHNRFMVRAKPRIKIEANPNAKPAAPAAPAVDPAMREMLAQMAQTQARMLEALTQRPDPMAQMQTVIAMAGAMKQAFGPSESAAPKSSITEIVQAVRELRAVSDEINPAKSKEDDDSDNPMKLLPGVLELVGKFAPQGGMQTAPGGIIPMPAGTTPAQVMFPPVTMPQSIASAPTPADAPAAVASVSSPVTQGADNLPTPNDEEMNALQLILFRGYVGKLCGMSAAGNVEAAAEYTLDKLPDEAIDILETPTWFEALAQFYPPAANHREWLTKVRERVISMLAEDEGQPPAAA